MKAGMIVTDLDGTLLRDDKTISDFTIDIIKNIKVKAEFSWPQRQGQSGRPANI